MVCYILCEKQWINDLGNKKWKYLCNHYELLWFVGKLNGYSDNVQLTKSVFEMTLKLIKIHDFTERRWNVGA